MAGRIPQDFIDDLLARVDIVDVINARVPLKKKGREFTACCPFHNEKTPSFTVSPDKQFYHCFGCGAHGTAISFLMDYEHLEFIETIESLAESNGMEVPRIGGGLQQKDTKKTKTIIGLLKEVSEFYQLKLKASDTAIDYLKSRGLSGDICKRYQVGYAPEGWQTLEDQFKSHFGIQSLIDSGLTIKNDEGRTYDRYRGRIQFPIRNKKGDVIGFGGRVLDKSSDTAKYINSPETTLFHKGRELYGLYEARKHTKNLEKIVVVEGYMDVIALAQFDISYAVATLGTATTKEHINILFRTTNSIIFCFDGDRAGKEAAWRALTNACEVVQDGKEIKFLFLPDGEDPDSYVRENGKEQFEALLDSSKTLTQLFIDNLHQQHNISSMEGKTSFIQASMKIINTIPETLIKEQLVDEISKLTSVQKNQITNNKFQQINKANNDDEPKNTLLGQTKINQRLVRKTPVRYAISLLLFKPDLVTHVSQIESLVASKLPGIDLLIALIETLQMDEKITAAVLLERWRGSDFEKPLAQLLQWTPEAEDEEILQKEFIDSLKKIKNHADEKLLERLIHKERNEGLSDSEVRDLAKLIQQKNTIGF